MISRAFPALALALLVCAACSDPVYSDDLGIQAVPAEPGALAGTFGYKSVSAVLLTIPIPGLDDTYGGTENFRLITRTWDAASSTYQQTSQLCGGEEYEVAGVVQDIPAATWPRVPASESETVTVDHGAGTFVVADQVQVWGANLPDPLRTPLPTDEVEATEVPHVDHIYDMDEDGNPGFTTTFSGFFSGRLYSAQRRVIQLEGITLGPDRVLGLIRTSYETVGLGGEFEDSGDQTDAGPRDEDEERGPPFEVHPDPKESWFEEVRIADGSTCADVMLLEVQDRLSRLRPF